MTTRVFETTTTIRTAWMMTACAAAMLSASADAQDQIAQTQMAQGIEEITVTGIKRSQAGLKTDTPLIETPQAISIIPSELFTLQGATNVQDTLRYSAGVRAESYGYDSRGDWAFIRGTDFVQYLDGTRMLFGYYNNVRPDPFGLESVEVLRGPSSVLYGQGTTGGVVNMVSKRPEANFGGEIGIQYGNHDRKQIQGDVTGPMNEDGTLLYRLVAVGRDSDTQTEYVPDNRIYLAPSITFAPTAATSLTVLGSYQNDDTGSSTAFLPHSGVLLPNPNGQIPHERFVSEPGWDQYDSNAETIGWNLRHRFNEMLELRQVGRWSHSEVNYMSMYPDSYSNTANPFTDPQQRLINRYAYISRPDVKTFTVDNQAQANFATGGLEHTLLAGIDYSRYREIGESGFGDGGSIDLYAPVYGNFASPDVFPGTPVRQTQVGFYVQDQVKLDDRFIVVAALRRDNAKNVTESAPDYEEKSDATTKRLGFIYLAPGGFAPYVSYAESFQPVAGTDFFGNTFKPQRGRQWEAGVKFQPDGGDYFITAALYDIREHNRLTDDPTNPFNQVQTGVVRSRGVELEGTATVAETFDLIASYSYNNVKVIESNNAFEVGKQLESVPKTVTSAWGVQHFDLGNNGVISAGAGLRYVGASYDYTLTLKTPSIVITDAMISWDIDNWRLAVNANNLFDKKYVSTCLARGDCFLGVRRVVLTSLTYKF